ncbi:MAG TPA: cysteine synthase family protein [Rhodopseudomonas sp.]|uniref:PLP-dependent cysteine synthase family protein n=1 Tax=Rhodopseudomonas sp. TaxID=1078 RepID=UPI002ED8EF36
MINDSVLDLIGNTPVVRLCALSKELGIDALIKLESFNPGGSHKVRVAKAMIEDAEARGILTRGSGQTIIEPSGGNTGIGLALVGCQLGYKLILVIPDNYSQEKQELLRLHGADVVLSDSRRGNNSHGEMAMEIQLMHPEYVLLNQQRNPANPEVHRRTTAREILADFGEQRIDVFVGGIGTGGHITGISETLKARWPEMKAYGVEPEQCDLLNDRHAPHDIQGLSVGIVPAVLNLGILDGVIKVAKADCIEMAKTTLRRESISLGISSAANLVAISKIAEDLDRGSTVLTLSYDTIDSYLSYFR